MSDDELAGLLLNLDAVVAEDGMVHGVATEVARGNMLWENHDAGTGGEWGPKGAFGLYGHMAVGDGRLWLASSTFYPGSYSLDDGSWIAAPSGKDHHFYGLTMRRGVDIMTLGDDFVITGSIRMANLQEDSERILKADGYNALSTTPPMSRNDGRTRGSTVSTC